MIGEDIRLEEQGMRVYPKPLPISHYNYKLSLKLRHFYW